MQTDQDILNNVEAELEWEPTLNAHFIHVIVKDGIATLSGQVDSFFKREIAEKAAKRVTGVVRVVENLDVVLPIQVKKTDYEIEKAVLSELKWNTSVREDKVKVKVKNGVVTLSGEVEWEFQRVSIQNAIKNLTGIVGLVNNVKLVPKLSSKEIKKKIGRAFHRNATIDAGKINVQTDGTKVTLTGKVKSWMEKTEAENTAWFAPGVTQVLNKLEIM